MLACTGCMSILVEDFILQILKSQEIHFCKNEIDIPCCGKVKIASLFGTFLGIITCAGWYFTKNWLLSNLLGLVLAISFLKTVRLTSLLPGILLLSLLFFYDIFWVFITPYFTSGG